MALEVVVPRRRLADDDVRMRVRRLGEARKRDDVQAVGGGDAAREERVSLVGEPRGRAETARGVPADQDSSRWVLERRAAGVVL